MYSKLSLLLLLLSVKLYAQQPTTPIQLRETTINAYMDDRPILRTPGSVSKIDSAQLSYQVTQSPVGVMNTIPGVRMEERSPGSYRLSIRGSLLRSPFGVRNVKVYLDEFPFTDAGGNTYLNLIDFGSIQSIEVLKGPDGSLFGANSGGVVRIGIQDLKRDTSQGSVTVGGGSYGLLYQRISIQQKIKNNTFALREATMHTDGYRAQSAFDRRYFQASDVWKYAPAMQLKFLALYSTLDYQTPGGLTLSQWNNNAREARPATATLPSAVEQHAGVKNNTLYGGISHEAAFGRYFRHMIAFFGSHTDFENPFITNYEVREENSAGVRVWLEIANSKTNTYNWRWNIGLEAQQTESRIDNYGNAGGKRDTMQAADKLIANQQIYFSRLSLDIARNWLLEGSASITLSEYRFKTIAPVSYASSNRVFTPQLMPKLAVSWQANELIALRALVSRGYSPPTLAEIRSSNNIVNATLQPEAGWNYETGIRMHDTRGRLWWDASVFYYRLEDAIVRRLDAGGNEYFVNTGGTEQPGFETQLILNLLQKRSVGFFRHLQFRNSYTYSSFKFNNYTVNTSDYSGNTLTGVPQDVIVTNMHVAFPYQLSLFIQHNYTSSIPLNDANNEYASAYNLLQLKTAWQSRFELPVQIQLAAGVDNLLNEKYSLGNDLNAFGGRYYNAAPLRNFFGELKLMF